HVDRLSPGQARPERDVAGHVCEAPVQGHRVTPGVRAEQAYLAGVRAQEAEQHADGGGLAGAVRAEEAVHLAPLHPQIQAVEGARAPEVLAQPGDLDRPGFPHHRRPAFLAVVSTPQATLVSLLCEISEAYKMRSWQ